MHVLDLCSIIGLKGDKMFKRKKKEDKVDFDAVKAALDKVKDKPLPEGAVVFSTNALESVDVPPPLTSVEEPEEVDVTGAIKALTSYRDRDGYYYVKLLHIKDRAILQVDELYKTRDKRSAREKFKIESVKKGVMV